MICQNYHKYGQTKTRCRRKAVCRNCGEGDHARDKTNKCPKESKWTNCGEGHMAGSNNFEVEIKERVIKSATRQQSGKKKSSSNPGGRRWVSRSNSQSYLNHHQELHPRKWKKIRYRKIERAKICHWNLKRKKILPIRTSLCSPQLQE